MSITILKRASAQSMRPSRKLSNKTRPTHQQGECRKLYEETSQQTDLKIQGFEPLAHRTIRTGLRVNSQFQRLKVRSPDNALSELQESVKNPNVVVNSGIQGFSVSSGFLLGTLVFHGFPMSVYMDNGRAFQSARKFEDTKAKSSLNSRQCGGAFMRTEKHIHDYTKQ